MIDSKKSLIIPVNYLQNNNSNNSNKIKVNIQKNNNGTLSTTSSSLMSSDEGCYGSSDFSCERIKPNNQHQLKQQHDIPISFIATTLNSNSNSNYHNQHQKQQQQNYCINNLSRFEKLYNTANNINSNVIQNDHVQVITSISGSYV